VHIATSQVKGLLGLSVPSVYGPFNLARTWWYILRHLPDTQLAPCLIGFANIFFIAGVSWINERFIMAPKAKPQIRGSRVDDEEEAIETGRPPSKNASRAESPVVIAMSPTDSSRSAYQTPKDEQKESPVTISRQPSPTRSEHHNQLHPTSAATNVHTASASQRGSPNQTALFSSPGTSQKHDNIQVAIASAPTSAGSDLSTTSKQSDAALLRRSHPVSPVSPVSPQSPPTTVRLNRFKTPRCQCMCRIPIPDILLAVLLSTLVVFATQLYRPTSEGGAGVAIIGSVPSGFPAPLVPWSSDMLCFGMKNMEDCAALISRVMWSTVTQSLTLAIVTV
jgi:hypothetical protein